MTGDRRRMTAGKIAAGDEHAFEAVAFQVRLLNLAKVECMSFVSRHSGAFNCALSCCDMPSPAKTPLSAVLLQHSRRVATPMRCSSLL
jgi:hypothetical protein